MKKILVVVDMQNDFVDGSLGTPEAQSILGAVVKKIRFYGAGAVYATRDTHGEDYLETQEGRNLPVVHCVRGTAGWELNAKVQAALGDAPVIDKPTFGSFELVRRMKEEREKEEIQIELIGLCTDICVVSNALLLKAALPETEISVDASCCAGVTPESHEAALTTMKMCQIQVTGQKSV